VTPYIAINAPLGIMVLHASTLTPSTEEFLACTFLQSDRRRILCDQRGGLFRSQRLRAL